MERLTEKRLEAIKARHGWGWRLERSESEELLGEINALRRALQAIESRLAIAVEALRHYADTPVSGVAERALAAIEAPAKADDELAGCERCPTCGNPKAIGASCAFVHAKADPTRCPTCVADALKERDRGYDRAVLSEQMARAEGELRKVAEQKLYAMTEKCSSLEATIDDAEKRVAELEEMLSEHTLKDQYDQAIERHVARFAELEAQLSDSQDAVSGMARTITELREQLAGERRTTYAVEWFPAGERQSHSEGWTLDMAKSVAESCSQYSEKPPVIVEVTEIRRTLDTTDAKGKP